MRPFILSPFVEIARLVCDAPTARARRGGQAGRRDPGRSERRVLRLRTSEPSLLCAWWRALETPLQERSCACCIALFSRLPQPADWRSYSSRRLAVPKENYVVKYQTIVREDQEIVVGRVKVPTPKGHAFVLRRYDTGAFSQTTLFKACFPSASDEQERQECEWVKASGDNANANGGKASEAVRLAGTWVVPEVALRAAASYGVTDLIQVRLLTRLITLKEDG